MMQSKGKAICLAVMLTVMLPAIAAAQPAVPVWGEWNQDQTVTGCIEIQSGDTLTIAPGVTVSFNEGAKLIVRNGGTLVADPSSTGCPDQVARIVFTRVGTTGGWEGIVVENGGSATLNYVDVMWATDTGLKLMSGACCGTLDNVTFSNCSGAAGGAVYTETSLGITDSIFTLNSASLYGGAIEATGGTLTLTDVWLEGNSAAYSGGAIDLLGASLGMVRGRVQGNASAVGSGIALYGSGAVLTNVFFYNNETGAVISRVGDNGISVNYCTFNGNSGLAALEGDSDANVGVSACIMYGNGATNVALAQTGGTTVIQASDVENLASLPSNWLGAANIDADPVFVAAGGYDLDPSSPAIGAAAGEDMGVTGGANAPGPAVALQDLAGDPLANPYDVGTALVGTPIVRNVVLANSGQESVTVASAVITGAQAGAYSVDLTPGVLAAGSCLDVQITFDPPAPGSYTFADLVITHSDGVLVNGLTGDTQQGTGSDLGLSDVVLDFGTVLVDTDSVPTALTITNPVTNGGLVEVDLAEAGDVDFFTLSETNFMIPSGGERTIWVVFSPESVRSYEVIVTPTVNGVERADLGILLLGAGTELLISAAPSDYQFPPTQVGLSDDVTVTVTNEVGTSSLMVSATQPGSGFSVVPASAPIAAGGTADFTVVFTPASEGFVEADLEFSATLGDNDQTVDVELRGIGIPTGLGIAVVPSSVGFDDTSVGDTSSSESFTVENLLSDFVIVDISSPATAEFDLVSASSFVLFPNGDARDTRAVDLTMSPSSAAVFTDSVTVSAILDGTAINVGTVPVALEGRGTDSALDIAPDDIDFGDVEVGTFSSTVSVSVVNVGTEPVDIFAAILSNTDDFMIVGESCSALTPLEPLPVECFYLVAATPQAEGTVTGELAIYTSDAPLPTIVDLEANGTPAAAAVISVDPATIDMGDVAVFVNTLSLPGEASVTMTNAGDTADLMVYGATFDGYDAAQFAAIPAGPYPRTIAPGASEDLLVNLAATGIGVRATTMTIISNAGDVEIPITAVSQVGYPNSDGFSWDPNGLDWSTSHDRGEDLYVVPGIFSLFYIQQITALTPLVAPADNFVWMEGPAFLEYLDNTGTWQSAAAQEDIESASIGATLTFNPGSLITTPAPVGEGLYTLHVGFDLVRDNAISEYDVHYVDFARDVVYGPKPSIFLSDTTLVGDGVDASPLLAGLNLLYGTSTTSVEVYITARDPNGVLRWWDSGAVQWQAGGSPSRIGPFLDVSFIPSPFIGIPAGVWSAIGYPINDPTMVGDHVFSIIFDRSDDNVLNDELFVATETVTVEEAP